jgi:hypothetical protein
MSEDQRRFCNATIDIEINGMTETVFCSDRADHPEAHSAKIWWSDEDEN